MVAFLGEKVNKRSGMDMLHRITDYCPLQRKTVKKAQGKTP